MKYCLNLPNAGPFGDARALAELAALAEDVGWDGVFLEDYILYQGRQDIPTYDPWVALAAVAMRTERIRLGTMVTPLARRRPWKVAREAVTVDHLSGGRLILAVGLGDSSDGSFTQFGEEANARTRAGMLDEALEIVVGLWSGEPFRYDGRYYQVGEIVGLPKPVQSPRIPIWVGGAYPNRGPLHRAARWDGACLYKATTVGSAEDSGEPLTPQDLQAFKRFVERQRPAPTPFDIIVHGAKWDVDEAAERERLRASAAAGATWAQQWIPPSEPDVMRAYIARGPVRIE
jgi:alkanesulfonate monooxygenase SsuD/methylene tetrahydromethanopterin reductase-like flavin-dependent oxidoreductase (luciferase family)